MFAWHTSPSFGSLALTEKRILQVGSHGKAHSAPGTSRKSALCPRHLTEKRILDRDRSASLRRAPSRRIPTFLLSGAACHPSEVLQASGSRGWTHSARRRLQTRGPQASFQPLSIVQPQLGSSPQELADLSPRHETSQDN